MYRATPPAGRPAAALLPGSAPADSSPRQSSAALAGGLPPPLSQTATELSPLPPSVSSPIQLPVAHKMICCTTNSERSYFDTVLRILFGPSGSASGSVSHKYGSGSGSYHHQAKIVRKTLISTVLWLLYDFLSLKNDVNVPVFRIRRIRTRLFLASRIRILTKMSPDSQHCLDHTFPW